MRESRFTRQTIEFGAFRVVSTLFPKGLMPTTDWNASQLRGIRQPGASETSAVLMEEATLAKEHSTPLVGDHQLILPSREFLTQVASASGPNGDAEGKVSGRARATVRSQPPGHGLIPQ